MNATQRVFAVCTLVLATSCSSDSVPASPPESFELKPRWKSGDNVRFETTKEVWRIGRERKDKLARFVHPVTIEVVSVDSNGFILRWKQAEAKFDDELVRSGRQQAPELVNVLVGVGVEIDLDRDGRLRHVRNFPEVAEHAGKFIAGARAEWGASEMYHYGIEQLTAGFADRDRFEERFLVDVAPLVFLLGRTYSSSPVESSSPVPFRFGPDVRPAVDTCRLAPADDSSGNPTITVRRIPRDTLPPPSRPGTLDVAEAMITAKVDPHTGWLKTLFQTTRVSLSADENVIEETLEIRRLP